MRKSLASLFLLLSFSLPVQAQRTTATVRGTVSDETGAVVAGASVTVIGVETGLTRTAKSSANGAYTVSDLPVGMYQIIVEREGFQVMVVEGLELNVADIRQVDVELLPGTIEEEITVTSEAVVVETIGGEVASLVTGEQVRQLPLNGRNFAQLTQLMPGVSAQDNVNFTNKGLLTGADLSVSGSSTTANIWTVDGAANNDIGSNRTILIYPSVDAIEEFKIHRNSYGPEFGGGGGAQVNLVTRSGTNQYKGSAYLFLRDDSLNEKNFFLKEANQPKELLEREDFGFTLGGPIVQDKLHFFISQEWNDETRGTVRNTVVPTAAERAGDFSQSVPGCSGPIPVDPLTGQPFPGNVIPADRIIPAGQALLDLYPLPTTTAVAGACNNWVTSVPTPIDWAQTNARLDYTITDSSRLLVRYTDDSWENGSPNAGETNGLWGDDPFPTVDSSWDQPGDSLVVQLNNVIGASSTNNFTFSMSGNEINIGRGDDQGVTDRINSLVPTIFPISGKTAGDDLTHPVYWGGATGRDLWNISPWSNALDITILKDDYQQVFGKHWFKAGVNYAKSDKVESCCGANAHEAPHFWGGAGTVQNPWGGATGNRIADILLEDVVHGFDEFEFQPRPKVEWEDIEFYLSDSWQVSPRLTVDYGVRYSRFKEPVATANDIVSFNPDAFDPALGGDPCNGITQVPGTDPCGEAGFLGGSDGVSRSFVEADEDNFAPRLGLAWDVFGTGNSVLRAGMGQFFQRERVNIQLDFGAQAPFAGSSAGLRRLNVAEVISGGAGFGRPTRGLDPSNETPYNIQYNLTWEQRLASNTTVEVSYVGNRGRHLVRKADINQIPAGDANGNGVPDRLEAARMATGGGSLRPFGFGDAGRILYWMNDGESEYDGLQTQFISRFGRGSQFQASYTLSRLKSNESLRSASAGEENRQITDLDNPGLDWGYSEIHRDHIFNTSLVWNGPTFENKGGFFKHFLGDWSIGTIVQYSSGAPLTIYYNNAGPFSGDIGIMGTGYEDNQRPLRVPGVSCGGSGAQIINPDAFTINGMVLGDTTQGAPRGACDGPDFFQIDLSFYKNFPIGGRVDGQFRIEIFNLTDEVNFIGDSVDNTLDPFNVVLDAPLDQATRVVSSEVPADFGLARAVRDPRQIQLGFKLFF